MGLLVVLARREKPGCFAMLMGETGVSARIAALAV
jgi:hypothetical protein